VVLKWKNGEEVFNWWMKK